MFTRFKTVSSISSEEKNMIMIKTSNKFLLLFYMNYAMNR